MVSSPITDKDSAVSIAMASMLMLDMSLYMATFQNVFALHRAISWENPAGLPGKREPQKNNAIPRAFIVLKSTSDKVWPQKELCMLNLLLR